MPIVPIPNATQPAIISPLPAAPVGRDEWIMLPTNPPQVVQKSDYEKRMKEQPHE